MAHDGGVARGDVEVALGVKANVRQRVPAEPDVGLAESLDLPGARAREELELSGHWLRVARYRATATAAAASTAAATTRQRFSRAGSGGRLPR